jgi:hypothetical protein
MRPQSRQIQRGDETLIPNLFTEVQPKRRRLGQGISAKLRQCPLVPQSQGIWKSWSYELLQVHKLIDQSGADLLACFLDICGVDVVCADIPNCQLEGEAAHATSAEHQERHHRVG